MDSTALVHAITARRECVRGRWGYASRGCGDGELGARVPRAEWPRAVALAAGWAAQLGRLDVGASPRVAVHRPDGQSNCLDAVLDVDQVAVFELVLQGVVAADPYRRIPRDRGERLGKFLQPADIREASQPMRDWRCSIGLLPPPVLKLRRLNPLLSSLDHRLSTPQPFP